MKVGNASREQLSVIILNQLGIYLLPTNKIIQLKCLPGTNTLAYFDGASMTEKKCLYNWFWGPYDPFFVHFSVACAQKFTHLTQCMSK
jgi:hypothetical protein